MVRERTLGTLAHGDIEVVETDSGNIILRGPHGDAIMLTRNDVDDLVLMTED